MIELPLYKWGRKGRGEEREGRDHNQQFGRQPQGKWLGTSSYLSTPSDELKQSASA